MKRKMIVCVLILASLLGITACSSAKASNGSQEPYPMHRTYFFDSTQQAVDFINTVSLDVIKKDFSILNNEDNDKEAEKFFDFISRIREYGSLPIPFCNGEEMPLRNQEGFHNIALLSSAGLLKPWFFYSHESRDVYTVRIMLLDDALVDEATENGADWYLEQIYPNAITTKNYERADSYKSAYVEKMDVASQEKAVSVFFHNDGDMIYEFIFGSAYVTINTSAEFDIAEFLKTFSIEELPLKS